MIRADSCSRQSLAVDEPMAGTAPYALGWIAIEQLGPYGPKALTESHLPPEVGARLDELASAHHIRPELIRPVGRHADTHDPRESRQVFLACSVPGSVAMATMTVTDPPELLNIDFAALAAGRMSQVHSTATVTDETILLVCTHAKRDVCCATLGRPLAEALAADPQLAPSIWECSHLGGHRFAPTAAQLPHGWVHGRLDAQRATAVVNAARDGRVELGSVRGRSSMQPAEQMADIEFRALCGIEGIDQTRAVTVSDGIVDVCLPGGESKTAHVTEGALADERPESCGKPVTQVTALTLRWL